MAKIKITSEPKSRYVNTKNGQRQVHFQDATLETEEMRIKVEVEIDNPQVAFAQVEHDWLIERDVIAGRFGPELARRFTLVPVKAQSPAKAA